MTIIVSCSATNPVKEPAETLGRIAAGVNIPAQPADCKVREAHPTIIVGANKVVIIDRYRTALNRANDRVSRCYDHREDIRARINAETGSAAISTR